MARHGEHAVTARLRFVNLRRVKGIHLYFIGIGTRAGSFLVGVEASPDDWPGGSAAALFRSEAERLKPAADRYVARCLD